MEKLIKEFFYSNWYYSGIRILSSIEGYQSLEAISKYFGINIVKTGEVMAFLVNCGLCQATDGGYTAREMATHVGAENKFVNNLRRNWRMKALEKFTEPGPNDIFYSSPVSISKEDAKAFALEIKALISKFSKVVGSSAAEKLVCLNIDWFDF